MNAKCPDTQDMFANVAPLVISIDPMTGSKTECFTLNEVEQAFIDVEQFKVKQESYIDSKLPGYDFAGCMAYPLADQKDLTRITGYLVNGVACKWDTTQDRQQPIDKKKVNFNIGAGVLVANTNKKYLSYVIGTDDINLFVRIANAGEAVVFNKSLDAAYQIINKGMSETIFRLTTGYNEPQNNKDLFVKLDDKFKALSASAVKTLYLEKVNQLKKTIDPDTEPYRVCRRLFI